MEEVDGWAGQGRAEGRPPRDSGGWKQSGLAKQATPEGDTEPGTGSCMGRAAYGILADADARMSKKERKKNSRHSRHRVYDLPNAT